MIQKKKKKVNGNAKSTKTLMESIEMWVKFKYIEMWSIHNNHHHDGPLHDNH